jgi:hypothetical protein
MKKCVDLDITMDIGKENRYWYKSEVSNIALVKPDQFDVFGTQPPDKESNE